MSGSSYNGTVPKGFFVRNGSALLPIFAVEPGTVSTTSNGTFFCRNAHAIERNGWDSGTPYSLASMIGAAASWSDLLLCVCSQAHPLSCSHEQLPKRAADSCEIRRHLTITGLAKASHTHVANKRKCAPPPPVLRVLT